MFLEHISHPKVMELCAIQPFALFSELSDMSSGRGYFPSTALDRELIPAASQVPL